jgi:uracil-DNA glycosylase family 4
VSQDLSPQEIAAIRRYLAEEVAAGRATTWEAVLSQYRRGNLGGSTLPTAPKPPVAPTSSPAPTRVAPSSAHAAPAATAVATDQGDRTLLFDDLLPTASTDLLADPIPGDTLDLVAGEVNGCTKCGLSTCRTNAVPGVGDGTSGIVFVGEAPGAEEDRRGEPFVGRAGDLLTKILAAMDERQLIPGVKIDRGSVYICNVLKCRPPENRNPLPHEIESCSPYLKRQLALLRPKIICCLGKFAAELLVGAKGSVGSMRGKVYRFGAAKLIVTYHPAACLRNPNYKRPVWDDMQLLAREYLAS